MVSAYKRLLKWHKKIFYNGLCHIWSSRVCTEGTLLCGFIFISSTFSSIKIWPFRICVNYFRLRGPWGFLSCQNYSHLYVRKISFSILIEQLPSSSDTWLGSCQVVRVSLPIDIRPLHSNQISWEQNLISYFLLNIPQTTATQLLALLHCRFFRVCFNFVNRRKR